MTILKALEYSYIIRRKDKPSHVGSHGTGWMHIHYLLMDNNLNVDDLLADDWEYKND